MLKIKISINQIKTTVDSIIDRQDQTGRRISGWRTKLRILYATTKKRQVNMITA
jgi:hypothetical protein